MVSSPPSCCPGCAARRTCAASCSPSWGPAPAWTTTWSPTPRTGRCWTPTTARCDPPRCRWSSRCCARSAPTPTTRRGAWAWVPRRRTPTSRGSATCAGPTCGRCCRWPAVTSGAGCPPRRWPASSPTSPGRCWWPGSPSPWPTSPRAPRTAGSPSSGWASAAAGSSTTSATSTSCSWPSPSTAPTTPRPPPPRRRSAAPSCGSATRPPGRSTRHCAPRARPGSWCAPWPVTSPTTSSGRAPGSSRHC